MTSEKLYEILGDIDERYVEEAQEYHKVRKPAWLKWGAAAACLCLVAGLFVNSFIKPSTTQAPLHGGILAEVTEVIDSESCEVVVTGEDSNFSSGDTLMIHYNRIHESSDKADRQLAVGDMIAVTYSDYEETNGAYCIRVEYVDLVSPIG